MIDHSDSDSHESLCLLLLLCIIIDSETQRPSCYYALADVIRIAETDFIELMRRVGEHSD